MMKVLLSTAEGVNNTPMLNVVSELQQRARLTLDCLHVQEAEPFAAWVSAHEAAASPHAPSVNGSGINGSSPNGSHTGNGKAAVKRDLTGKAAPLTQPTATLVSSMEQTLADRFGQALKTAQPVESQLLAEVLFERSAYNDLVLMSSDAFAEWVLPKVSSGAVGALKTPIFLPSPDHRSITRVLVPSEITFMRMVTPLRRFLFADAELVLYTCHRSSSQQKRVVGYAQAHAEQAGYYAVDAMEGKGLGPMLTPRTLLTLSLSSKADCASSIAQFEALRHQPYANWGLSFLILP